MAWRTLGRSTMLAIAGTIAVLAAAVAAVIPGATIHLTPRTSAIGPFEYRLTAAAHSDAGQLDVTATGTATGKHVESTPAKGTVTFSNYNAVAVLVPVGTQVSAGKEVFGSDGEVSVPPGVFTKRGIVPGTASVAVTATHDSLGPDGNVAAGSIDTIDDEQVAANLGGPFRIRKDLVVNPEPLTGGSSTTSPEVTQKDVDAVRDDLQSEAEGMLGALIAGHSDRVYVSPGTVEQVTATIPDGLVGTRGEETFNLSGTLAYARTYALGADLQAAAAMAMHADAKAIPAERMLIDASVTLVEHDVSTAGGQVVAHSSVSGKTAPAIDIQALKSQIAGLSAQEAEARLDALGTPRIDFWPGWVTGVPRIGFRVEIVIEAPRTS
jgi:Baseplate J-like protein